MCRPLLLCCFVICAAAVPASGSPFRQPPLIILVLPPPSHSPLDDTVSVDNEQLSRRTLPDVRTLSIGGIVGAIPWLPLEVNVPDAVAWLYQHIINVIPWNNRPQNAYIVG